MHSYEKDGRRYSARTEGGNVKPAPTAEPTALQAPLRIVHPETGALLFSVEVEGGHTLFSLNGPDGAPAVVLEGGPDGASVSLFTPGEDGDAECGVMLHLTRERGGALALDVNPTLPGGTVWIGRER